MGYRDEHEALLARNAALEEENARLRGDPPPPQPSRSTAPRALLFVVLGLVTTSVVVLVSWRREPEPEPRPESTLEVADSGYEALLHPEQWRFGGSSQWRVVEATGAPELAAHGTCSLQRTHRQGEHGTEYDPLRVTCVGFTYDAAHEADASEPVRVSPPPKDDIFPYLGVQRLTFSRATPPLHVVLRPVSHE